MQLSPFQEQIRDLLEASFIEAWGTTTPVKLFHKPSYPRVPWVQLAIVFGDSFSKTDGKQYQVGIFTVGIIFPLNEGMEYGLGLAGRAVEILKFKKFKKDALEVICKKANIGNSATEEKRCCYLVVVAEFKVEQT